MQLTVELSHTSDSTWTQLGFCFVFSSDLDLTHDYFSELRFQVPILLMLQAWKKLCDAHQKTQQRWADGGKWQRRVFEGVEG